MAQRKPLVMKQGVVSEMAAGDSLPDGEGFALVHGPAEAIRLLLGDSSGFAQALQQPGAMDLLRRWRDSLCGLGEALGNPLALERLLAGEATRQLLLESDAAIGLLMQTPHAWRAAMQAKPFRDAVRASDALMERLLSSHTEAWQAFTAAAGLKRSPLMTSNSAPGGKVSASAAGLKNAEFCAMDGRANSWWLVDLSAGEQWLGYEFAQPEWVVSIEVTQALTDVGFTQIRAQCHKDGVWADASDAISTFPQPGATYAIRCQAAGRFARWRLLFERAPAPNKANVMHMTLKALA
ncbi:MAG: hypothetical protein ACTTJV_08685 [Ottowia sp.]